MSQKDNDILEECREFFKLSSDAEKDNRERGLRGLEFAQGGDKQWDNKVLRTRRLPGKERPCKSYNQLPNFINQVANDGRMNMAQTKFVADDEGDEETAEKMEDVAREIQTRSDAEVAYDTAFYGQVVAGWGYWRYETDYCDDKSFDQIIRVKSIDNQFMVYDDPFVTTATQLDRRMLIEASMMPRKAFNKQFDEKYDDFDCASIGDKYAGWATKESIRVAEFWKREEIKTKLWKHKESGKITKDEPEDADSYDEREVISYKVKWYLCTADQILQRKDWVGQYIPYVKVVGHEVNINGEIVISGMVERLIPAQEQMNYFTNAAIEAMAIAPLSPWIADPVSIAPYQEIWDSANIINYAYLPADTYDTDGRQLAAPRRNDNGANLSGYVAMVQMSQQNFYNLSGIFPASLGQASNEKSGKAIIARQKESDVSTFHIHDNMARGQRIGGAILGDLIPLIYDASRTVNSKKYDGTHEQVTINKQHKGADGKLKNYDFSKGKYAPIVTTGPSYTTKRQEAVESQIQLAQAYPQIMQIAGSDIVRNFDWPGSDVISDKLKILEQTQFPQLAEEDNQDIPPQVAAQMQQMQQVIEQAGQQIQAMQAELESKQADTQIKMAEVQAKQGDYQLKAQQQQLDANESQRRAALDAEELRLEEQKLANDSEKNQLEQLKIQLEFAKLSMPAPATSKPKPEIDTENPHMIQAQLQTLAENRVMQEQESALNQQNIEQEKTMDMAKWDALMQSLEGVQQMLGANAQATQAQTDAILAPRTVMRDPKTGLAQAVVTS